MRHKLSLWVLLLMLGAGVALGQYSGTYTIMPSGGDFSSHDEAADSLMAYGVVGPCTLLMYTGTYTGQAYFQNAPWDSVEVAFVAASGESPEVSYSSYPWYIYYTNNITVDGIATSTSASYAYYIYYSSGTKVRNQRIGASSYGCYAYRSPSTVFENCNISVGSYGLYFYYSDSCRAIGNRIRAGSYGIRWYYAGMRHCVGNNITCGGSYGIYNYRAVSGYSYYDTIAVNMMNGSTYGIYQYYHYYSYVYGNTFYGGTYGYYSSTGYSERWYNNIFRCTGTYPFYKSGGNAPAGSDYNCFYGSGSYVGYYSGARTLPAWRGLGYDSSGMLADPLVGGPSNLHLKNGSPCIDSGMAHSLFPLDVDGDTIRNGVRDIGADEWYGVGAPMSGPYLIHQDPDSGDYDNFADAFDDLMLRGASGDITFNAAEGIYSEQVTVGDGAGGSYKLILQPRFYGTDSVEDVTIRNTSYVVEMSGSENVTLQGFNIVTTSTTYGVRMYYIGSDYTDWCVVRDCYISAYYGIYMYYANHCSIIGNRFPASGYYSVYSYYSDANVYINNMFASTGYGGYFYNHDSTKLLYNSIAGNYYGWMDYYGYYETMYNNILWGQSYYAWYKYYGNANPAASDYNCFWAGYQPNVIYHSSYGTLTLAQWQSYSGMDMNSIARDPLTRSPTDLHLKTASPCRDSAMVIAAITDDFDGDSRDTISPDIGCDEWRSPGPPMSGIFYIHPDEDSGDYTSFLDAWDDIGARGFGGDITLRAYSGTYLGDLDLGTVGNDSWHFTMEAVPGETPVIQATGGSTPAVSLTSAYDVTIRGLTMNGYYGLRMWYTGSDSGCCSCSIIGNNINGSYMATYIYRGCYNVIAGNIVRTSGYYGLYFYGYPSGSTHDNYVYNNMIISSYSYGYGGYFYYHSDLVYAYNSLYGTWYYGMYQGYGSNQVIKDNIFVNNYSGSYACVGDYSNSPTEWDWNCLWNPNDCNIAYKDGSYLDWSGWQAAGRDSNGINANPYYVSGSDLHLTDSSPCLSAGNPVPGITTDIDGEARSASRPAIGCDDYPVDGSVDAILAPTGLLARLYPVTPQAVVSHVEGPVFSGRLVMVFDSAGTEFWRDTSPDFACRAGESDTVEFAPFTPQFSYTGVSMTCWHTGTPDINPSDDTAVGSFNVDIIDIEVLQIDVPSGQLAQGDTVNPSVLLRNNSLGVRSLYLTFVIDDYTGSEASIEIGEVGVGAADVETDDAGPGTTGAVIDLAEGTPPATGEADAVVYATIQGVTVPSADTVRVNFAVPWVATPSGTYFARTWHALLTDEDRSNDSLQQDFAVVGEGTDVALTQVVYPRSFEQSGTDMTPTLRCRNNGPSAVSFMGYVMLYDPYTDSLRYSEMKTVPSLESEATTLVEFPVINLGSDTGVWGAYCSLYCAGDIVPGNNVVSLSFTVSPEPPYEPGWTEMASMPLGPSGKPVKRGAWATLHVPTDRIYAAKGYKTTDFYSYDPYADLWDTLSGMPYTTHPMWGGRVPRKGSKGVSDGEDIIYVTQGNNTLGFWAYSVSMDSWWILPDVPIGDRRKKVKGGTDLLYLTEGDTGYVYLLKGYKNEFYRFNVVRRAWEPLENAPIGIREKYDKGSWLAHDPMTDANVMYAHKAKYHEFYKFRRDSLKWEQTNMGGMPFIGKMGRKKKSKDGGSADIWAGEIYALKGGNTQELWKYDDSLGWTELETIPAFGSTQRKKRVKYGADLVHWNYGIFFTLKGNKTVEWWRYVSHPSAAYSAPRRSGVMAEAVKVRRYGITVAPNPLSDGVAQVRFALPRTGPVTLSVFDMAGRAVEKQTVLAGRSGSARLDLRGLSAGVYLVKVEAGEYTDTRKLVVNH